MENGKYQTSDLYLASYLAASGFKLIGITSGPRKSVIFEMTPEEGQKEVADYYNGAEISAIDYSNSVKNIKSMIMGSR